jgi:hypothetical protein
MLQSNYASLWIIYTNKLKHFTMSNKIKNTNSIFIKPLNNNYYITYNNKTHTQEINKI